MPLHWCLSFNFAEYTAILWVFPIRFEYKSAETIARHRDNNNEIKENQKDFNYIIYWRRGRSWPVNPILYQRMSKLS
jgi:hypothetical protein